ncbi:MAG: hypothetical protein RR654_01395 [Oscillospiraceae bacterium]
MKTITAVYKMVVYNDGDIEIKPMPLDSTFDNLEDWTTPSVAVKVSEKIRQIMSVLNEVSALINNEREPFSNDIATYRHIINIAIKNVAYKGGVTQQTVADKLTRGLKMNKQCFIELVCDFFKNQYTIKDYRTSELYKRIRENLSKKQDLDFTANSFIKII